MSSLESYYCNSAQITFSYWMTSPRTISVTDKVVVEDLFGIRLTKLSIYSRFTLSMLTDSSSFVNT